MRQSGVLLPISALPSPYGIGTLGAAARAFLAFLHSAGQSCWQLLPLGPTSFGDSPYQSCSSWAGNPYFIDLDDLTEEGLLRPEEYRPLFWGSVPESVDYALLYRTRFPVLRIACGRLWRTRQAEVLAFRRAEGGWLEDYALFMALKTRHSGASWDLWPEPLRRRAPEALERARRELEDELRFWVGVQYLFFHQWRALRARAAELGIALIGDLPIYSAGDSADVWAHQDQFQLDGNGHPTAVAGCPPDAFSDLGQLWGNPLFRWDRMAEDGYAWWISRIRAQLRLYDCLRIDHFRGFDAYYAIPAGAPDARGGQWRPGPGMAFFRAVKAALHDPPLIAEDLGILTDSVRQMLRDSGYPGMRVLEFAFDDPTLESEYLPHRYGVHCVAYAGTHDNDTLMGWLDALPQETLSRVQRYLGTRETGTGLAKHLMHALWESPAERVILQMQDLLLLPTAARMNLPSTVGGNWRWRLSPAADLAPLAQALRREMIHTGRLAP